MAEPFQRLRRFLAELERRNVYRVAVAYLVAAFVVLQLAGLSADAFGFPGWFEPMVWVVAGLGFPLAIVVAWAFEMTAGGVRRTPEAEDAPPVSAAHQWIGLGVVVLLAGGIWYVARGDDGGSRAEATAATDTTARTAEFAGRREDTPPRIAVLPFENISRDSGDAFFARGMHEEVLNQLSKVSGLEVISRTSVTPYADTDKRVPTISEELGGVDALLEGSVRRVGDRVRIAAQLIDAPEDAHLWSETYQRELSPQAIFEIQADIAEKIAGNLQTELTSSERRRIEEAPTSDLAAYDAYLAGRSAWWRVITALDPGSVDRAIEKLRQAVRRDPAFAEAHAWLALAYGTRYEISDDSLWRDSATAAIQRARDLTSRSPAVHVARANLLAMQDSMSAAERAARRALDLQPSNSFAAFTLSRVYQERSDWPKQIRWASRAVELDPRRAEFVLAMGEGLISVGLEDAAEAWFQRARELDSSSYRAVRHLSALYRDRGEYGKARRVLEEFLEERPDHPSALTGAAVLALYTGDYGRASRLFRRLPDATRRLYPRDSPTRPDRIRGFGPWDRVNLGFSEMQLGNRERGRRLVAAAVDSLRARIDSADTSGGVPLSRRAQLAAGLAALGRDEAALDDLERLAEAGYRQADWLQRSVYFDDLRSSPRFGEVVDRVDANRRAFEEPLQEEVRRLDIDLYPPGAAPDTAASRSGSGR